MFGYVLAFIVLISANAYGANAYLGGALFFPEIQTAKAPEEKKGSLNLDMLQLDVRGFWQLSQKNFFEPFLSYNLLPQKGSGYEKYYWALIFPFGRTVFKQGDEGVDILGGIGLVDQKIKVDSEVRTSRMASLHLGLVFRARKFRVGLDGIFTQIGDSNRRATHLLFSITHKL